MDVRLDHKAGECVLLNRSVGEDIFEVRPDNARWSNQLILKSALNIRGKIDVETGAIFDNLM